MPARIELPDSWANARSIVTALAEGGYRFNEYLVLGKPVLELDNLGRWPTLWSMRGLAIVTLTALVPVLGGCGGGGGKAADGPLSSGLSIHGPIPRGGICAPGGRTWAFGFQSFTNYGKTTLVVDRVVLLHPRNEHLVGSYAVPGDMVLGAVHWPVRNSQAQPAWKDRQPVHGFRLALGKSFNMVLGVAAIAEGRWATSQGMLVYYYDSSGTYVAKNYWANTITANTHTCPH